MMLGFIFLTLRTLLNPTRLWIATLENVRPVSILSSAQFLCFPPLSASNFAVLFQARIV